MIPMTLRQVADVVGGTVHGDALIRVTGPAYVDSRSPEPDGLFVAVVGEHVDGHDFAAGAHAVLGSRPTEAPTVVVDDPVTALGRLARHVVDSVDPHVIAITGSQGKTGTKDYLAHLLSQWAPTVATLGNHNNEIGVPLTALRITGTTAYLVVEMGARGVGHIAHLCSIAPPDVAAVLNVGTAHLGEFGSRERIALAKGEIVEALPGDGVALLNADDPLVVAMADRTRAPLRTFGEHGDYSWGDVTLDDLGRPSFEVTAYSESFPVALPHTGLHQVANAVAAAGIAHSCGHGLQALAERLSTASPASRWRMELHERSDGLVVVNDAYNANPASMAAAIETLAGLAGRRSGRGIAVLGEMLELGPEAREAHLETGRQAAALGLDVVVTVGEQAALIARGANDVAAWSGRTVVTAGRDEALTWVRNNVAAEDVVLVKASRGAALEHVADGLLTEGGASQ